MDLHDLPPAPVERSSKLPFNIKVILPIVALVAALPFLAKSVRERQLTQSQAAVPNTFCGSLDCPTPTPTPRPPCVVSYPCPTPYPSSTLYPTPVSAFQLTGRLVCQSQSPDRVDLIWSSYPGTYRYFVTSCTGQNCGNFTSIASSSTFAWQGSINRGENKSYKILAEVGQVNQPMTYVYSNIVNISDYCNPPQPIPTSTPTPGPILPAPILSATAGIASSNLSWTYNGPAVPTEYHIEWCTGAGCVPTDHALADAASPFIHTGTVTDGTVFGYRIRAHYHNPVPASSAFSPYSNTVYVTPVSPGPVLSVIPGINSAKLSWTYSGTPANEFHIYRCTGAGCIPTVEETPAVTSSPSLRAGLATATTYGYRIRAHYHFRSIFSPYSNTVYVTPASLVITPTPSLRPSPVPPPNLNHAPQFVTFPFISLARVGKNWSMTLTATDADSQDIVNMIATGFPSWVITGPCVHLPGTVTCTFHGTATSAGTFHPSISALDNHLGITTRSFNFYVTSLFGF